MKNSHFWLAREREGGRFAQAPPFSTLGAQQLIVQLKNHEKDGLKGMNNQVDVGCKPVSRQAGKSLYTTIRELVENSLDAAESIGALPLIELTIEEFTEAEFNEHRGMDNRDVVDAGLFTVHRTVADGKW